MHYTSLSMDPAAFHFESEQQRQIYDDLLLFGDGPAAFFKDACRLVAEPTPYECTTHLVGHLLREIHSAIEAVLQPAADEACNVDDDSRTVRILRYLGFTDTEFVFMFWPRLDRDPEIKLAAMAHRTHLQLRARDNSFDRFWSEFQDALEELLDRAKDRLLDISRPLESLAQKDSPTPADIKAIRKRLPHHHVFLKRFFDNLQSSKWLDPLEQAGYFDTPPRRIERDGNLQFMTWPQSSFLARIASQEPERVRDTILMIPLTDNDAIVSDFAEAALAMPPMVAEPVVEKIIDWIEERETLYLVEPIAQNISHLAKAGFDTTAFRLAEAVLHLEPLKELNANHFDRGPKLRIDSYLYEQFLSEQILPLKEQYLRRTLQMLCIFLDHSLPPVDPGENTLGGEWDVYYYRDSIAGEPEHPDLMFANVLINAVRDVACYSGLVPHTIIEACSILDSYSREVFKRIKLHMLAQSTEPPAGNVKTALLNPEDFNNSRVWQEYSELLGAQFASLSSADKNILLSWIARGPRGSWPEDNDVDREKKIQYWKFKKLNPIHNYLVTTWKTQYEALSAEFEEGNRERERLRVLSEGWEVSPIEKDVFARKRIEDIVTYIQNWTPGPEEHPRASTTSLLRMLEELVADDPIRFVDHIDILKQLDSDALSHIFSGLTKAISDNREFEWSNALRLCQLSLDLQQDMDESELAEHDRWMRQVIAQLIVAGLSSSTNCIPQELRDEVLTIVIPLTRDSDPTPEKEDTLEANIGGASSLAFNSVRGYAIRALFEYAKWLGQTDDEDDGMIDLSGEVWTFMESYVANRDDWNRTNHYALGQWIPICLRADAVKTLPLLKAIFPEDEKTGSLFNAAWEGYVLHWNPHKENFKYLRTVYRHATDGLSSTSSKQTLGSWSPSGQLARHLYTYYGWDIIDFGDDDRLLETFITKAPLEIRTNALQWIGGLHWDDEDDIEERNRVLQRYQQLFERRITYYENNPDALENASELESFGKWIVSPYYDDDWCLNQLQRILHIVGRVHNDSLVLKHFETIVLEKPGQVLECVRLMLENSTDEWAPLRWHRRTRAILEGAMQSQDTAIKDEVRRLVNRMATRGMRGFDDLLD